MCSERINHGMLSKIKKKISPPAPEEVLRNAFFFFLSPKLSFQLPPVSLIILYKITSLNF